MIDREIDREKVAEALECYRMNLDPTHCEKKDCPYNNNDPHYGYWCCSNSLLYDAVALLKAEKKTKVVFKQYDGSIESECGNCGLYLDKAYSRCPKCNKELDWNGG